MRLKDEFEQWFIQDEDEYYEGMVETISIEFEKIAEDFTIRFRDFCNRRAKEKPFANVVLTSKELLEIYKQQL